MIVLEQVLSIKQQVQQSIIGQEQVIDRLLIALLCNGNVLLEGLPGLAKTRAIKTLSKHIESTFKRIQFTADLLPSDVTGTEIYVGEAGQGQFQFQQGPVFGNLVLADEINRAPAKVQAALLEAMEERQVTVAGKTYGLPDLFMVLATQNPIEQEGTYPLPEAQMDRFLLHVYIHHPSDEDELRILDLIRSEEFAPKPEIKPVAQSVIFDARREIQDIESAKAIDRYIVALVSATRNPEKYSEDLANWIQVGVSPRATLALDKSARAHAWLAGRNQVLPEDVRAIAADCLRHRLVLSYHAGADGITADDVVESLLERVALPA